MSTGPSLSAATRIVCLGLVFISLGGCLLGGLPGKYEDVNRTVTIDITGRSFGVDSIPVRSDETIRFVVRNHSSRPHDFTIGTPIQHKLRRHRLRWLAAGNTPIGRKHATHDYDAYNAVVVPAGTSREIVWKFSRTTLVEFADNLPTPQDRKMRGAFDFDAWYVEPRIASNPRRRTLANARSAARPAPLPEPPAVPEEEPPTANVHPPLVKKGETPVGVP